MSVAAPPLDKAALVQSSFRAVRSSSEAVAALFYARLFMVAPECRPLFPQDLTAQKKKLMDTLAGTVASLNRPESILPELRALGVRHARYGAEPSHYHLVGASLLFALEQTLGPDWTPELARAWEAARAAA